MSAQERKKEFNFIGRSDTPPNKLWRRRKRYVDITMPYVHEIAIMMDVGGESFAALRALRLTYADIPVPNLVLDGEKISFTISHVPKPYPLIEANTFLLTVVTTMENEE